MAALLWTPQATALVRIYTETYIYVYTCLKKKSTLKNKTKQNGAYITPRWPQALISVLYASVLWLSCELIHTFFISLPGVSL